MLNIQNTQITLEKPGEGYAHVKFDDGEEKLEVMIFPGKVVVTGDLGEWMFNDAYEVCGSGCLDAWYHSLKVASNLGHHISAKRLDQAEFKDTLEACFSHWLEWNSDIDPNSRRLNGILEDAGDATNEEMARQALSEIDRRLPGANFLTAFNNDFPLEYTDKFKLVVSAVNHAFKLLSESDSGVAA